MTTRSGWVKSWTAEPSRRNSGFDTTSNSCFSPLLAQFLGDPGGHPAARAHGHGALVHDHPVTVHRARHAPGRGLDVLEVRAPVVRGWSAHGDEDDLAGAHGQGEVGREGEPSRLDVARHHVVQARLEYRDAAAQEGLDLALVVVDADNRVPEIREAGPAHEADIARPYHRYPAHHSPPINTGFRAR